MPVFTKRIKDATSFIQAIEPLDIVRSFVSVFTKRIENATSFIRITKPLGIDATSFVQGTELLGNRYC